LEVKTVLKGKGFGVRKENKSAVIAKKADRAAYGTTPQPNDRLDAVSASLR